MVSSASLTVVVLNWNGAAHLPTCLDAVLALEGLSGPAAVLVADNGSTDGSGALMAERFPAVRWLPLGENSGFAAGNDRAAAAVDSDWLLFLNNDTRARPDALAQLWPAVAAGAACAGARLVSWDGRRLDFDGGAASFTGHGHALGYGRPVPGGSEVPRPTLFASGAAMLVRRDIFLAVGGFDPSYFAYYEDVDLGWRLWLAGHSVCHVPTAVVHHRHHGSAAALASGAAARLYERNALATVVKNYADDQLARMLPAALALAALRAGAAETVLASALPPAGAWPPLPPASWSGWPALAALDLDWPALLAARARVQALRRRPDAEVLALLARPWAPAPASARMRRATDEAVARFGLAAMLPSQVGDGAAPVGRDWPRQLAAWREGGPGSLLDSARSYLAWRRAGRP